MDYLIYTRDFIFLLLSVDVDLVTVRGAVHSPSRQLEPIHEVGEGRKEKRTKMFL